MAFIYYYGWYGNPGYDGAWSHWQENDHEPPWDIASSFYPKLGAYSSRDPGIVDQHMRWIAASNIHGLIYSWWGKKDPTHRTAKLVLDAAADYNLKVAFLIEPYPGRTPDSICDDIEMLNRRFSNHPAFLKLSRATKYGPTTSPRGVFFIYDPDYRDSGLMRLSDAVHSSTHDSIILFQSTDASMIGRTHSDGIFAYEAVQNILHFYQGIMKASENEGGIFVPCVVPGFNINRATGKKSPLFRARKNGRTYDDWWENTLAADPEYVAVISFNEWHEGTQIEPAIPVTKVRPSYLSYESVYAKTGPKAQLGYLRRTARWIRLLQQLP